ncbi:uncharacterized protein PF3D7_1225600-like [Onthophagus taurus]|uniref:uncharacterized protein PF3D7_1225600-like n=1 Tax=Onthophagus taurus TaxID=166361 RepID=UPI0039BECF17
MESYSGNFQKFTMRLRNILNDQITKCIQMKTTHNFNENGDNLAEETFFTSRSKNSKENPKRNNEESKKYLNIKKLFPKCQKKTLSIDESLQELKRIELEIKMIEEDIETNHKELTQNTKFIYEIITLDETKPTTSKNKLKFTKWRSKIKTPQKNEFDETFNENKIIKVDVSSKEINISPTNFEPNSETDYLSPFTSMETTPENSSLGIDDLTISEWISNLICKSKSFLIQKFRSRSKFSVDSSDDDIEIDNLSCHSHLNVNTEKDDFDFNFLLPTFSNKTNEKKRWTSLLYSKLFKSQNKDNTEVEMKVLNSPKPIKSEDDFVKKLEETTDKLRSLSLKEENSIKTQTNGFKKLFPEESLQNINFWEDESIPEEVKMAKKDDGGTEKHKDFCELFDIIQNIKESFNERREILSFHDTKSDHLIKPLKVLKEYRRKSDEKF